MVHKNLLEWKVHSSAAEKYGSGAVKMARFRDVGGGLLEMFFIARLFWTHFMRRKKKYWSWFRERPCLDPVLAVIESFRQQNEFFYQNSRPKKIRRNSEISFWSLDLATAEQHHLFPTWTEHNVSKFETSSLKSMYCVSLCLPTYFREDSPWRTSTTSCGIVTNMGSSTTVACVYCVFQCCSCIPDPCAPRNVAILIVGHKWMAEKLKLKIDVVQIILSRNKKKQKKIKHDMEKFSPAATCSYCRASHLSSDSNPITPFPTHS